MVLNLSFAQNQIKQNTAVRISGQQYKRIEGFPALYIDRYSYISQAIVRTPYGEPDLAARSKTDPVPEGAYSLSIGAFNSISWDVHFIIDQDHDYKSVSMADCEIFKTGPSRLKRKGSIIIQNDVWIGQGCTIYGGVTIHNGAVVAGNSVVTKDVPPYCIVGGAPARPIKPRFEEDTIRKLLQIQWWNWSDKEIRQNREWFEKSPEEFAEHFYQPAEKENYAIDIPQFARTYLFFPDFDEPYGVWRYVVLEFCKAFSQREDYGLVLFIEKSKDNSNQIHQLEKLTENIDAQCNLYVYAGSAMDEKAAFSHADYYITSRSIHTVKRSCLADQFGIPTISGMDLPIF